MFCTTALSVPLFRKANDKHRTWSMPQHSVRNAAEQGALNGAAPMAANDDEIRRPRSGHLHDLAGRFTNWRELLRRSGHIVALAKVAKKPPGLPVTCRVAVSGREYRLWLL
jgi:hypothetical protein